MIGIIRLICERDYVPDSPIEKLGDCRVFDVPEKDGDMVDRIEEDMKKGGWYVTRVSL